jgi:hypothetical protein
MQHEWRAAVLSIIVGTVVLMGTAAGQTSVLTYHNDNMRTGQNTNESTLTTANVNTATFGKLFSQLVDGQMYAQPLYVPSLSIPGLGTHNVVFVATEADSVYAFDADSNQGANANPLWKANLIDTAHGAASGATPVSSTDVGDCNIKPQIGVTGTPVIDTTSGTMYILAASKENGNFVQRLHALNITTGAEKSPGPRIISTSTKIAESALTSFTDGHSHVYYVSEDQNIHELYWTGSSWTNTNVTGVLNQLAAARGAVTSFKDGGGHPHVYFITGDQHIHELYWTGSVWNNGDVTGAVPPNPAASSPLASYTDAGGGLHIYFTSATNHVRELYWNGSTWANNDVTGAVPPNAAANSALTSFVDPGGHVHIYFTSSDQHVHELYWTGSTWTNGDITAVAPPVAASGSALTSFSDSGGHPHVYYLSSDQHVHELYWTGSTWTNGDISAVAPPVAAAGSSLTGFGLSVGPHVYYLSGDQHVHELYWNGSTWTNGDVTASVHPNAASGSALSSIVDSSNRLHIYFTSADHHAHELYWNGATWTNGDMIGSVTNNIAAGVFFDPKVELNRTALLLSSGNVYVGFGSHCDQGGFQGWMFAFSTGSFTQNGGLLTTSYGNQGGVWMSGSGPAADANGKVYLSTGNGSIDTTDGFAKTFGNSIMKLNSGVLTVSDYFTPFNAQQMNLVVDSQGNVISADTDLGSGGVLLLPDQPGTYPHLLVQAGKPGAVYLINRDQMTTNNVHYCNGCTSDTNIVQELPGGNNNPPQTGTVGEPTPTGGQEFWWGMWSSPAYWNGTLYFRGIGDHMKAFRLSNGLLPASPTFESADQLNTGVPGGGNMSISGNGDTQGIVWSNHTTTDQANTAVLRAYDATNANMLYSSDSNNSRDYPGDFVHFAVPTVANGKVYVGAADRISVYGLNPP